MKLGELLVKLRADTSQFDPILMNSVATLSRFGGAAAGIAGVSLALGGVGLAAVRVATDFEAAFARVERVIGPAEANISELRQGLIDMSTQIPVSAGELAAITSMAGQMGVTGTGNLLKFTDVVARLGVTADMSGEACAQMLGRIAQVNGIKTENIDRLASAVLQVGARSNATAAEVLRTTLQMQGLGAVAGLSAVEMVGFSAAMASGGLRAESSGNALGRMARDIAAAVALGGPKLEELARLSHLSADEFSSAWKSDKAAALFMVFQGLSDRGDRASESLKNLGWQNIRVSGTAGVLSKSLDDVKRLLEETKSGWERNTALTDQSGKIFGTTASSIQKLKDSFEALGIAIGTGPMGQLKEMVETLTVLINKTRELGSSLPAGMRMLNPLQSSSSRLANVTEFLNGPAPTSGIIPFKAPKDFKIVDPLIDKPRPKYEEEEKGHDEVAVAIDKHARAVQNLRDQLQKLEATRQTVQREHVDIPLIEGIGGGADHFDIKESQMRARQAAEQAQRDMRAQGEGYRDFFSAPLDIQQQILSTMNETGNATSKTKDETVNWHRQLQDVAHLVESIGLGGFGKIAGGIAGVGAGLDNLHLKGGLTGGAKLDSSAGLKALLGNVSAGLQIAGVVASVVSSFAKPEYRKVMEDVGKSWGVSISESTAKAIEETEKTKGVGRQMAELLNLDKIVDESGFNSSHFSKEINNLMEAIANGVVPAKDGIDQLGKAFKDMKEAADGGDVSSEIAMVNMINRAKELNQIIPAMSDAIKGMVTEAANRLADFYGGMGSSFDSEGKMTGPVSKEQAGANMQIFSATFEAKAASEGVIQAALSMKDAYEAMRRTLPEGQAVSPDVARAMHISELIESSPLYRGAAESGAAGGAVAKNLIDSGNMSQKTVDAFGVTAQALMAQAMTGSQMDRIASEQAILPVLTQLQHAQMMGAKLAPEAQAMLTQAEIDGILPLKTVQDQQLEVQRQIRDNTAGGFRGGSSNSNGAGGGSSTSGYGTGFGGSANPIPHLDGGSMGLTRFRGHLTRGGYDVQDEDGYRVEAGA
jgi:TP901 family phage tail tape measure protein